MISPIGLSPFNIARGSVVSSVPAGVVSGTLRKWDPVTILATGPTLSESDPTTATDYRVDVTFTHPGSGKTYVVPGHFAADGNAANTSATTGNKFRCYFAPDETGLWNYQISFRTGALVAVDANPLAGASAGFFDGATGSFTIAPNPGSKGMLRYIGEHFLQWAETGEYFLKAGVDSPENPLAFADFDGTFHSDTFGDSFVKTWANHVNDYTGGAQYLWQTSKGAGLLGALEYLKKQGLNGWSTLLMNIDGDDQNIFPYITYNAGAAPQNDRLCFDISKLDQWNKVFDYSDFLGLYMDLKFCENENYHLLDGDGTMGTERTLFFREIVSRFGHHLALKWDIGEEIRASTANLKAQAEWLYNHDPYRHLRVVHNHLLDIDTLYDPLQGNEQWITGTALQLDYGNPAVCFNETLDKRNESALAGVPWVVESDEQANGGSVHPNGSGTGSGNDFIRKNVVWANYMAGGAGIQHFFGGGGGSADQDVEDFRTRDEMWPFTRYAYNFFKDNGIPFWQMGNEDALLTVGTGHVLRKSDEHYVVYLPDGGGATIDLTGQAGNFVRRWYNPRTGQFEGTAQVFAGGTAQDLGTPPNTTTDDWAIWLHIEDGFRVAAAKQSYQGKDIQLGGGFPSLGLIHSWKFDEESGDAIDDIGGNNGVVNGATQGIEGKLDNAYQFDGVDDHILLDQEGTAVDLSTTDFSLSFWINVDNDSKNHLIFAKLDSAGDGFRVRILNAEEDHVIVDVNSVVIESATSIDDAGGWYHVVFTADRDGNGQIYINGAADGAAVDISAIGNIDVVADAIIGANNSNTIQGQLDDLKLWNRVLTAQEVANIYNNGNGSTN